MLSPRASKRTLRCTQKPIYNTGLYKTPNLRPAQFLPLTSPSLHPELSLGIGTATGHPAVPPTSGPWLPCAPCGLAVLCCRP